MMNWEAHNYQFANLRKRTLLIRKPIIMSSFISYHAYIVIFIFITLFITINRQKNGLIVVLDHTLLNIEIDNQLLQKRKERGLIMLSCPQHDDELVDSGEEDNYEFASHAKTKTVILSVTITSWALVVNKRRIDMAKKGIFGRLLFTNNVIATEGNEQKNKEKEKIGRKNGKISKKTRNCSPTAFVRCPRRWGRWLGCRRR